MLKSITYIIFSIFLALPLFSQKNDMIRCHTKEKLEMAIQKDPSILLKKNHSQKSMDQWMEKYERSIDFQKSMAVVTIPVVFHILYKNNTENISDAQIQSQLDVLNADFRKINSDFGNTPSVFQAVAADVEIEFCLASFDVNGNTSTGITRTSVANNFNLENNYFKSGQGGAPGWDRDKYLNIWVGSIGGGILGFAWLPNSAPTAAEDGVVIDYRCFGTSGTAGTGGFSVFNLGRTTTHEVGHWFNLEHIWGPGNGGCGQDDFVSDTPNQNSDSFGCPSFPQTDACTSGNGIMFQNYMDYSDDRCMSLFTAGQKTRMLAALNGPRSGLLTSTGCQDGAKECGEDITISVITQNLYDDAKNITSTATISNGQNITFSASTSIELISDFTVNLGGTFLAMIEDCPE